MIKKYVMVEVSGIITQIAIETEVKGYTIGVLESFLPDEEELKNWNDNQVNSWVKENNDRMKAICQFLNEKNL